MLRNDGGIIFVDLRATRNVASWTNVRILVVVWMLAWLGTIAVTCPATLIIRI
jgi:hypothetical protein